MLTNLTNGIILENNWFRIDWRWNIVDKLFLGRAGYTFLFYIHIYFVQLRHHQEDIDLYVNKKFFKSYKSVSSWWCLNRGKYLYLKKIIVFYCETYTRCIPRQESFLVERTIRDAYVVIDIPSFETYIVARIWFK